MGYDERVNAQAKQLFDAVLELPMDERDAFAAAPFEKRDAAAESRTDAERAAEIEKRSAEALDPTETAHLRLRDALEERSPTDAQDAGATRVDITNRLRRILLSTERRTHWECPDPSDAVVPAFSLSAKRAPSASGTDAPGRTSEPWRSSNEPPAKTASKRSRSA